MQAKWANYLLSRAGHIDAAIESAAWGVRPMRGRCKLAWLAAVKLCGDEDAGASKISGDSGDPAGSAPAGKVEAKLDCTEHKRLESQFCKKNKEILSESTTPTLGLVQILWSQKKTCWNWVAWKKTLSKALAANLARQGQKSDRNDKHASQHDRYLSILAEAQGVQEEQTHEMSGGAHTVFNVVSTRCRGMAILDVVTAGPMRSYVDSFMKYYTKEYPEKSGLRPPNVEEAEEGDQMAWEELIRLVDSGLTWEEAVQEVIVVREFFAVHMAGRMRLPKSEPWKGKGRARQPWEVQSKGVQEDWPKRDGRRGGGDGKRSLDKGKGDGKGKNKRPKSSLCFDFQQGKCERSAADCRFIHRCQNCHLDDHGAKTCKKDA